MKTITRGQAKTQGLTRFYTGKPCSQGHMAERAVSNKKCVICRNLDVAKWKKRNPIKVAIGAAAYHKGRRGQCFDILGHKCACCGEDQLIFLCVDHRNGGGNVHRRSLGIKQGTGGARFFKWLIEETIRIGRTAIRKQFRILCCNCNNAFAILGYCPHHPRRK